MGAPNGLTSHPRQPSRSKAHLQNLPRVGFVHSRTVGGARQPGNRLSHAPDARARPRRMGKSAPGGDLRNVPCGRECKRRSPEELPSLARTWPLLSPGLPQSCKCWSRTAEPVTAGRRQNLVKKLWGSRTLQKQGRLRNMNSVVRDERHAKLAMEWAVIREEEHQVLLNIYGLRVGDFVCDRWAFHLSHCWGCRMGVTS